jgi:hypothetical protein
MTREIMARNTSPLERTNGLSVTIRIRSYPQCDLENDREEGVIADINKCNECDGDKEKKVSRTWKMMTMTVEMKNYIGRYSEHDIKYT